jgi:hypothetical protein
LDLECDLLILLAGDIRDSENVNRFLTFQFIFSRWRSLDLTYRISKYPSASKMSKKMVQKQIREAFSLWSSVTDLTFTERSYGPVHMDIRFESK